jgi:hypothetical protein
MNALSRHVGAPRAGRLVQEELAIAGRGFRILVDGDDDRLGRASSRRYWNVAWLVEQKVRGNLEAEAWATLRRVLDLIEACKVEGDPQAVFAAIEEDLRAQNGARDGEDWICAVFGRGRIRRRCEEGMERAKAKGVTFGRKRKLEKEMVRVAAERYAKGRDNGRTGGGIWRL